MPADRTTKGQRHPIRRTLAFIVVAVTGVVAFNGGQQAWATYQDNRNHPAPTMTKCSMRPGSDHPCIGGGGI